MNEKWTFWRFLASHTITIPIIQRDYAQGRKGKEELRKAFLNDLRGALDFDKALKLDFVYGAAENGEWNPLDGQQRLTTLWLIHWYLAYMAGEIDADVGNVLKKFSYETRRSSCEFCKRLSAFTEQPSNGVGVVTHIQNQTWFRSSWRSDPTIQSMLRMLGGTGTSHDDCIEFIFSKDHLRYWKLLTSNNCPIVFYALELHGIHQTDGLYIKMNARGKPLTSFENLKADLAGFISQRSAEEKQNGAEDKSANNDRWIDLANQERGLVIKMDTDWLDGIFWKFKSADFGVDEIVFAFLNRFFFNAHAISMDNVSDLRKGDDKVFDFLYGRNRESDGDDERIAYLGFDSVYRTVIDEVPDILQRLQATLDNFLKFAFGETSGVDFKPSWDANSQFQFIPRYSTSVNDKTPQVLDFVGNTIRKIDSITQSHRVVFHAICRFFERGWNGQSSDVVALKNWMRVVWNIVENADINTVSGMVGCLKLIDEISVSSHDILVFLSNSDIKITSSYADEQIREEKMKARKLIRDGRWEAYILRAEKMVWLKGRITVLFHDGEATSIEKFNDRLRLLEAVFKTAQTKTYYLQKVLLSRYDAKLPKRVIDLSDTDVNKKNLLTRDLSDCFRRVDKNGIVHNDSVWISDLTQSSLLDNSRGKLVGCDDVVVLWGTAGRRWASFGNNVWGNVILGKRRNLMVTTPGIELEDSSGIVPKTDFVCGRNINFKYKGCWFQWWGIPDEGEYDVYLLRRDWRKHEDDPWKHHIEDASQIGDKRELFCFNVSSTDNCISFAEKLDGLISELEDAK